MNFKNSNTTLAKSSLVQVLHTSTKLHGISTKPLSKESIATPRVLSIIASTVACGDGVWFLVTEAHSIHRLTSIADNSLEREK